MLAKTGPVTYKIQCYAVDDPETIHVDKLLPYQADLGEELQSWLQDIESTGHLVLKPELKLVTLCHLNQKPSQFLAPTLKMRLASLGQTQQAVPTQTLKMKNPLCQICHPDMASALEGHLTIALPQIGQC